MISKAAEKELREAARSGKFRNAMHSVAGSRHNPFIKNGAVDTEAYILFVSEFSSSITSPNGSSLCWTAICGCDADYSASLFAPLRAV